MKSPMPTLQLLVQDFFQQHLVIERKSSRNTVTAYRDAVKLFLNYAAKTLGRVPDQLDHSALDAAVVRPFLHWLESERHCGARTRNHRLAALKAFARYVASVAPEHLERCRQIRDIPPARFERREVEYLDDSEVVQLVRSAGTTSSRRTRALLLLLYNTGARVQEVVDLDIADFHDDTVPFVRLRGKGRKQRTCPLWQRTAVVLRDWLHERPAATPTEPLFLNARGQRLSRSGIAYILRRLVQEAALQPRYARRITPHVMRHTTAMHLLQSGVDITTIAAWLGHAQLSTTHGYVEIDLRMKRAAISASANLPDLPAADFPAPDLLDWLEALGRRNGYVQRPAPSGLAATSPEAQLHITARGP